MNSSWDQRWLDLLAVVESWSKDKSRKTAAIIVDKRHTVVSMGWNGFPRGVSDNVEERHKRPAKYLWTEHAERNAIYNAAARGHSTEGCRMYIPWYPCADCARAIIQSGIEEVLCIEPDWNDFKYKADFEVVREMLKEAEVRVTFLEGSPPEPNKEV